MIASRRFIDRRMAGGVIALAIVAVLAGGALAGLAGRAIGDPDGAFAALDTYLLRVARFTLVQAVLSTLLSVALAIPVAHALARQTEFPGRGAILQLFAVPLALPAIVVALGVLALYGRAGLITALPGFDDPRFWPGVYGLPGILIAHVFFNMPLAVRLLLGALSTVPSNHWRLGAQLGMNGWQAFRLVEWPAIRTALPGIAGLILMLCITSFAVVLILGGGPRATTLEVAIYQSLRIDFDPARAIALTLVQISLTGLAVALLWRLGSPDTAATGGTVPARAYLRPSVRERLFNTVVLVTALAFVGGPMAATVAAGLRADLARLATDPAVLQATATSLAFATASAFLCTALSFAFVAARWSSSQSRVDALRNSSGLFDAGASLVLVLPPIVLGAGWFILAGPHVSVFAIAPVMVIAVNAVMAMPFAIRALRPAHDAAARRYDRICAQLGITGLNRMRNIDWPVLRGVLATAFIFAMALSLGDLGVIALFGSDSVHTLPYLIMARMGAYRTADAAGLSLWLGVVCFVLMYFAGRSRSVELK